MVWIVEKVGSLGKSDNQWRLSTARVNCFDIMYLLESDFWDYVNFFCLLESDFWDYVNFFCLLESDSRASRALHCSKFTA